MPRRNTTRKGLSMRRPHPATIISSVALFVALSGGAYAATQLPRNSVGSAQVRDGSLLPRDFKSQPQTTPLWPEARGKRGKRGPTGPAGPQGAPGQRGAPGVDGADGVSGYEVVQSEPGQGTETATCPAGKVAVSGGFDWQGDEAPAIARSAPVVGPNGKARQWRVSAWPDPASDGTITVYAVCIIG